MHEPDFLLFASDATLAGMAGAALLALSFTAWLGDYRRRRRNSIDAVGCMPWSTLSFFAFFVGVVLLALAAKGWLAG